MGDWPSYHAYRERLTPGTPPIQVELPQARDDEFDLLATVKRLATEDPVAWKATVRMHTATDWYFMMLMLSGSQRLDPFTGRPEVDCEFQFNYSRQKQFEGDGWVDKTAREHFKCGSVSAPVVMADGGRNTLGSLLPGDSLMSYSQGGRSRPNVVCAVSPRDTKDVLCLRTRRNRRVTVTPDHRLLTQRGWVRAGDLGGGDWLGVPRRIRRSSPLFGRLTVAEARFLGFISADGCTRTSTTWTNADESVIEAMREACVAAGLSFRRMTTTKYGYSIGGALPLTRMFGVYGCLSIEKRLPDWFFSEPDDVLAAFLGAFFDCDGGVSLPARQAAIGLGSPGLCADLQHVLDLLGIASTLSDHRPNGHAGCTSLTITGAENFRRFLARVPLSHRGKRLAFENLALRNECDADRMPNDLWTPLLSKSPGDKKYRKRGIRFAHASPSTSREKVMRYALADENDALARLAANDVRWERIADVSEAGRHETVDIQVARDSCFIGDGVVSHNSTWEIYVGVTVDVVNDPESAVALFAFEKAAAEKHGRRVKNEWETNAELKAAWDDVFFWDPEHESPLWNMDKGLMVKRRIVSPSPTFSWYSIKELPTGLRISKGLFDDIETEQTVSTEEARKSLKDRVTSALNLGGRACRWRINGTHHSPAGWIAELESSGAWKVRCHAAEDVTRPAPDIAAIYDACDGMLPVREDLGKPIPLPPEVRNIRLAGAPVFLHPLECAHKRLLMGPQRYAEQNMGDALAGQVKRLDEEWIRWYTAPPTEWARGANLYIVVDPSKGVGDPTFARVEACKSDRTISWVGGLRRRLSPSEFGPAIFQLAMEWTGIGTLIEIRVEEFAQSTWTHNLRTYFDSRNHYVAPVVACSRHNTNNKVSEGRLREWSGLEPLYRMGRRVYPKDGIWVFDELGHRFDLVKFYVDKEYKLFPLPPTDDGLAADYLLAVTKGKNEAGKEMDLSLDFPETEWEEEVAARSEGRWNRRNRGDEGGTWMSDGVY